MENITQTKKKSLQLRFNTFNLTSRVKLISNTHCIIQAVGKKLQILWE